MAFLSPAFLWTFLALIPLGTIYFLKVRPRKKSTTAYSLWEKIFSSKKATSLFNRLRDLLSLLLMMLAFSAIALALSQPEFTDDERTDLLILVDHSASMATVDDGGSRLDRARETAREIVNGLNGTQRAAVASVGRELKYHSHLTASPRELLDAIDVIPESDFPFDVKALETLGQDAHWGVALVENGRRRNRGRRAACRDRRSPSAPPYRCHLDRLHRGSRDCSGRWFAGPGGIGELGAP